MSAPLSILIVSSPVGPLGSGPVGGVTRMIENTLISLDDLGHKATLIAPAGSQLSLAVQNFDLVDVAGNLQPSLASNDAQAIYPIVADSVLAAMWRKAYELQGDFDVIVNFAHDWLPYYLTPIFDVPVAHMINLGNVCSVTTGEICRVGQSDASRLGLMSSAQATELGISGDPEIVSFGIDTSLYQVTDESDGGLCWAGRISPEKGLEDALCVAAAIGEPLEIAGPIGDVDYWKRLSKQYDSSIRYHGYLGQMSLQKLLGQARALLQTQKWNEAFGIVTIEAMACGTPVIAYDRGANSELVKNGVSGYLVDGNDVQAVIDAVRCIQRINRNSCRQYVVENYSLSAYTRRLDQWIMRILKREI